MRTLLAAVVIAVLPAAATAQPAADATADKEAVLATVNKFLETMAAKDVAGARAALMPEGRLFIVRDEKGQSVVRSMTHEAYLERLTTRKENLRERIWNPEVRIHGGLATVWTPYDFWIDGKFSHCGVDAFDLVKTAEGWRIAGGAYTVEPRGCAPSPLGPLK